MTTDLTSGDHLQVSWKKRLWRPLAIGGFVLLFVAGLVAYVTIHRHATWENAHRGVKITYEVEGTAKAVKITYTGPVGDPEQIQDVTLPWTAEVTVENWVLVASVWATSSTPGGTVTCRLFADGQKVAEQTSGGGYISANCVGVTGNKFAPFPATRDVTD